MIFMLIHTFAVLAINIKVFTNILIYPQYYLTWTDKHATNERWKEKKLMKLFSSIPFDMEKFMY
jgi:hypothetical protein